MRSQLGFLLAIACLSTTAWGGTIFEKLNKETILKPTDPTPNAFFGAQAAIGSDTIVVGSPGGNGAVYVFTKTNGVFSQSQKIVDPAGSANDQFGNGLGLDGDTLAITAFGDDNFKGSVHIYVRVGGTFVFQQRIQDADADFTGGNGLDVKVSGDTLVIGCAGAPGGGTQRGVAFIYVRNAGVWTIQQKLKASNGIDSATFGRSVAIQGNTVVVGAPGHNSGGATEAGAAYVYTRVGTVWGSEFQIQAPSPQFGAFLGFGVSLDIDTIIVGALGFDVGTSTSVGRAYVFTRSGAVWNHQQDLFAKDGDTNDGFGIATRVVGDVAIVGAYTDDGARGSAYIFTRSGTTWTEAQKLVASDRMPDDQYGAYGIGIFGNTAICTANNGNRGYIYEAISTSFEVTTLPFDRNPLRTGVPTIFRAITLPTQTNPSFRWRLFDATGKQLNESTETEPSFTFQNEGRHFATVRVFNGVEFSSDVSTLDVFALAPNVASEVTNILDNTVVTNPIDGTSMMIPDSFSGVIDLDLSTDTAIAGEFNRATDTFETELPVRGNAFTGSKTAEKFDKPGIRVVVTTRKRNGVPVGKVRRMIPVSSRETGVAQSLGISGREIVAPSDQSVLAAKPAGKVNFGIPGKIDKVTLSCTLSMPSGLDMSKEQTISVGLGNVFTDIKVDGKGKNSSTTGSIEGIGFSISKFSIKVKGLSRNNPVTQNGQTATIKFTMTGNDLSRAGFDTEGISKEKIANKETKSRAIQSAFVIGGVTYFSKLNVDFTLNNETGIIKRSSAAP